MMLETQPLAPDTVERWDIYIGNRLRERIEHARLLSKDEAHQLSSRLRRKWKRRASIRVKFI
jgi:hypothetical protein